MNGERFKMFLGRLIRSSTRKIFLIVDRLRAHNTPVVRNWIETHKGRIELFNLSTYSPESNPDEYLNNDLKANVHAAGLPNNKDELRSRARRFMRRLAGTPEHVMSYFKHPNAAYAAAT